jgi:hypothetical protein
MKERGWIEPIVERVVGQVLESHAAQLRSEIVSRVMEEIAAEPVSPEVSAIPAELARAVAEIQMGGSQREILRSLLDTSSRYATRVALFVVKGSDATGWQGRGFANGDALKDFALDKNAPAVLHAIGDRVVASAPAADLDQRFLDEIGTPASGASQLLPLILKDKVAALVYADSGTEPGGQLDAGALELLVLSTAAWLEVRSLRKQAQKELTAAHAQASSGPPAEAAPHLPAYNDPFAAHDPGHAMAAAASAGPSPVGDTASPVAEMDLPLAGSLPIGQADPAFSPETLPAPTLSTDQDIHNKAQRFARLLVDEIKLYNQAKVGEGRKNKDLYDRLKEAIEKSRATYQKRYGNTDAASGNYFQHEIIRSLAEDDLSIMGANFRQ